MATHAPITGAPTRASNILPFPADPIANMPLRLTYCRTASMLEKWTVDLRKLRPTVPEAEYAGLVARGAARRYRLSVDGASA